MKSRKLAPGEPGIRPGSAQDFVHTNFDFKRKTTMGDKIRFALSALMWAVVLIAAYALAVHAQTSATSDQDRARQKNSGVASQASSNKPSPEAALKANLQEHREGLH